MGPGSVTANAGKVTPENGEAGHFQALSRRLALLRQGEVSCAGPSEIPRTRERITHLRTGLGAAFAGTIGELILLVVDSTFAFILAIIWFLALLSVSSEVEQRFLGIAKALDELPTKVISVPAGTIDPANEGKLVHVTGTATAVILAQDEEFRLRLDALRIRRTVETYQWDEVCNEQTVSRTGESPKVTRTYSQSKIWYNGFIDAKKFQYPASFTNPIPTGPKTMEQIASGIVLGAFALASDVLDRFTQDEPLTLAELPPPLFGGPFGSLKPWPISGGIYFGADPAAPAIGDRRVLYKVVNPVSLSVIAMQKGNGFAPYPLAGSNIEIYVRGSHSVPEILALAREKCGNKADGSKVASFILLFPCLFIITRWIPRNSRSFAGLRAWVRDDSFFSLLLVSAALTIFFQVWVYALQHLSRAWLIPIIFAAGLIRQARAKRDAQREVDA